MSARTDLSELRALPLARRWRSWRPRGGYAALLLTWAAVFLLPLAATYGHLLDGIGPAQWLATLALAAAWALAHTRVRGWQAALLLAAGGVAADLYWGVYVLRFGPLLRQLGARLGDRAAAITFWREQGELLASFARRTADWVTGFVTGRGGIDNLVVLFLAGLAVWLAAAWAGWWVARHGQALIGVLPAGIFLAQHAYWAPQTAWAVVIFITVAAALVIIARLGWQMRQWDRTGVDYAETIPFDAAFTALAIGLLVLALSPLVPSIASGEFSRRFWRVFQSPYQKFEQQVGRSFAAVRPVRSLVPPTGAAEGGLPRAHLLGGARELGEQIALRVRVRGDVGELPLYWRGQTYAAYTGRGWEEASAPLISPRNAGEPWAADAGGVAGARTLVAAVEVVAASRAVVYGPGEPLGVDRPYRVSERGPGELIALLPQGRPDHYTVLSRVVAADPTALRAAGQDYPPLVSRLYLALPPALDPALAELAAQWTRAAATPYDAALAIEQELRRLPYTLDVPAPPPDRELVAWFLFDLRRGYCDYYATALVVLARLRGIPARLAIGYATGDLDASTGQYVATELNAHSWPELYFPRVGWVAFEPTPGRALPDRPAGEGAWQGSGASAGEESYAAGLAQLQSAAASAARETQRRTAGQAALAALNGLGAAWTLWAAAAGRTRPTAAAGTPAEAYRRLGGWARRLGARPAAGVTPRELAATMQLAAAEAAQRARWRGAASRQAATIVREESAALAEAYEREMFAASPRETAPHGAGRWRTLWAALRRVWLAQRL